MTKLWWLASTVMIFQIKIHELIEEVRNKIIKKKRLKISKDFKFPTF